MVGWLAEHCIFPVLIPLLPRLNMTTTSPVEWGHLQFLIYVCAIYFQINVWPPTQQDWEVHKPYSQMIKWYF
jgi:hypothetical protein